MDIKSYWISLMVWFCAGFLEKCQGSTNPGEFFVSNQTTFMSIPDDNSTENNSDCRNITGHLFEEGMEFVPAGVDYCKLCICVDGQARSCRHILCAPPACKSFQMGLLCCEFKCLNDLEESDYIDITTSSPSTTAEVEVLPTSNSITLTASLPLIFLAIFNIFQNPYLII